LAGFPGNAASLSWTDSPGFHLQQNAQAYVPHKYMQAEVAEDIRTIFNAPDRITAEAYLAKAMEKYQKSASRLSA
jgi:transposase-like protein